MVTLYLVKTNKNARLTNIAAPDAILRGHSVCCNEPTRVDISASRFKLHF